MVPLMWAGLIGGAMGAGAGLALLLVVVRAREPLVALGGIVSMGLAVAAGNQLRAAYDTAGLTVVASLLAMGAFGGGFALVSALLAYVTPGPPAVQLPRPGASSRTLAIMLLDIEPEVYSPGETTREIAELVEAGLPEPAVAVMPLHYAAHKARYRAVGDRSPEAASATDCAEKVEARLDPERIAGPATVRCADPGALAAALERARHAGYEHTIVAGVYVAESSRVIAQRRAVDEAADVLASLRVSFTRPLWTSDELAQLVAERAIAVSTGSPDTGVALLVHGQPPGQAQLNPTFDVQENAFANRVRALLGESGLDEAKVRVCATEWRDPGVSETVRHLAALGSRRIVVVPACYPFANLQVLLDVPAAARDARIPDDVHVVHVAPWGEDEVFAKVIANEIARAAAGSDPA